MRIESNLPENFPPVVVLHNNKLYNQYGIVSNYYDDAGIEVAENLIFIRIDGDDIFFFAININITDDLISFQVKEFPEKIHWNANYNELEGYEACSKYISQATRIKNAWSYNQNILYPYIARILAAQDYYETLLEKNINLKFNHNALIDKNLDIVFYIFLTKMNKNIPFLIQNEMWDALSSLFTKCVTDEKIREMSTRIDKKVIKLSKELKIDVYLAAEMLTKFTLQDLLKYGKLMDLLDIYSPTYITILNMMGQINLNDFANYFVKSLFVYNNIKIHESRPERLAQVRKFLELYRDYIRLIDRNNADLYPIDLETAHDAALENKEILEDRKKCDDVRDKFHAATEKYMDYAYEDGSYCVVIPNEPEELYKESAKLHHCVKTYINDVANEHSKICLVRFEGKPYMTVEIVKDHLIQAKKTCNHLPNESDEAFLKKWCDSIDVNIDRY